jgi:peptide/nickel transport system substrate-binding protein
MKKTLVALCLTMLIAGVVFVGCAKGGAELGKNLVAIALQGEPSSLDPQFADDGNMRAVTDNVFERLMELDGKTLQPVNGLAVEYKNVDATTWEFKIRKGVKFHDGSAFTAEDAVFSVNRIIDPAFKSQISGNFASIKGAELVDKDTIRITTNGPDPILLKRLTKLDIVSKKYVEANKDTVTSSPIGTGPYKVTAWNRGVDIQAAAFDGYWGKKPAIKNVKYRFIQEASTRLSALKAGEISFAMNMLPEYAAEMPKTMTEKSLEIYWLRFNQLRGPMVKQQMRLAANLAIDRQTLADTLFAGAAAPAEGQMAKEGYFGFSSDVKAYPFDKEQAAQLLKEAGYKGEVIELVSERGRWLKDGEVTEAVAAMLVDAGFNVKIKFLSWQEWLDTLFNKDKAPAIQFSSSGNEFFDMDRVYGSMVESTGSQSAMSDKAIDAKIAAARQEMDSAKRQAMYDELAKYFYENPYGIPLLNLKDMYGMSKNLEWTPRQDSRITVYEMSFGK